jgi:stage III sporulation protein SpoIIIAA
MNVNDDLEKLIENLPFFLQEHLNQHPYKDQLIEIVLRFRKTTRSSIC